LYQTATIGLVLDLRPVAPGNERRGNMGKNRMAIKHFTFTLTTEARHQFIDITEIVRSYVAQSDILNGIVTVYSQHTSCCVLIQEESEDVTYYGTQLLLQDTLNVLQKIIPPMKHEGQYLHPGPIHVENAMKLRDERPEWSLNTDGHIMSSLIGRSEIIPVDNAELILGTFGRIYFGDLDAVRARERIVRIQIIGE
jgi:secondary thiamine-phosphate synthase enzyme